MRRQIWLLALVVSAGLGCVQEETRETKEAAAPAARQTSYILEVSFTGLVGYVNVADGVWALLPKAHRSAMPPGVDPGSSRHFYPEHYAALKVDGKHVKGFGIPGELLIPLEDYELELPQSVFSGSGTGLPAGPFKQDLGDAAVEKLASGVLGASPPPSLAARMKLPLTDLNAETGTRKFVRVYPRPKSGGYCAEPLVSVVQDPRVERVVWTTTLTTPLELKLRRLRGMDEFPLVLEPAGQATVKVEIVNQVAEALHDSKHDPSHWPAYRWYYSLSDPIVHTDCEKHYYPQGVAGGNRCPQKLYTN